VTILTIHAEVITYLKRDRSRWNFVCNPVRMFQLMLLQLARTSSVTSARKWRPSVYLMSHVLFISQS